MKLKKAWIDRIFERLAGIYGLQFSAKFPNTDEAKGVWAAELGAYDSRPEAIQFALDNLPIDHAPNVLEFREICRRAPREEPKRPEDNIPANPERAAEFVRKAESVMAQERDHLLWAKRPAHQVAMNLIVSGCKTDPRLRGILREHIANGVCNENHTLLRAYRDGEWVKA